jgi:predicted nucleic acid-binding protein
VEDSPQPVLALIHSGTLTPLVVTVRVIAEAIRELDRELAMDSSTVRHQHAGGVRRHTVTASDTRPMRFAAGTTSQVITPLAGPTRSRDDELRVLLPKLQ